MSYYALLKLGNFGKIGTIFENFDYAEGLFNEPSIR